MARSSWGSKRQRSKNVWELRYTVAGEPKSETYRGTAKGADRRLGELRLRYEGATADSRTTVGAFFRGVFVPECEARVAAPPESDTEPMAKSTLRGYVRHYESSIGPTWDDVALEDVRARAVQAWLSGMTYGAARQARATFRTVLNRAVDLEYIEAHPLNRRYILPSARSPRRRSGEVYGPDELQAIFEECEGEFWEPFFILAAFGGAQRAEAVGVFATEVEWVENELGLWAVCPINRGVHLLDGEVVVEERAKNDYRAQPVVVPPPYSLRLRAAVDEALAEGREWLVDDGFGGPLDPEAVTRAYKSWLGRSTHRYVPFGNLRNSYSTMLHREGYEDSLVAKLMRHANLTTDYAHYNRLDAAGKIEALSRPPSSGKLIPELPRTSGKSAEKRDSAEKSEGRNARSDAFVKPAEDPTRRS